MNSAITDFAWNMIDFLTGLALVGAAVSAIACAIAKLRIENGKWKIEDRPQFSILHSPFSIHTAVFVFFAAIATLSAQKGSTNAPPRSGNSGNVELRMENVELRNLPTLIEGEQFHNYSFSILHSQFPTGLVLARVGTNETFTFSAPSDATMQAEWLAFGAANDWFPVETNSLSSPGKWSFPLGTSSVSRLAVFSSGTARPRIKDSATFVSPLSTSIGIVPSSRHSLLAEGDRPSLFWHRLTPDNSLVLTWQNVLLGRDASSPVSFQAELFESGDAVFRYDLGRLSVPVVSNVVVGASADGVGDVLAQLPTNVTSLAWRRVDPEDADDPDRDGDGISTEDELFVYGTDPHSADTDNDGLSDYDELFVHDTDPLDPNSVSAVYSDGLAVKIGDLDPFSCPSGSTNTVLEHVFYSGTTNGAFAYPQSSDDMAVLRVSVSGSGSGDLVVGNQVVPLLAPPQLRSAPPSPAPPLLVPVAKGVVHPLRIRGDAAMVVSLGSEDFAFGELPSLASNRRIGWLDFPYAKATEPCIHDYNARRKVVSLPAGSDAAELVCTWQGGGNVEVENNPPRTATITGNFSARGTSGVTYTLSHPKALFGPKSYAQAVRFCPQPPDPDPEEPDPSWYSDGDGDDSGENDDDHDEHWCCFWGTCDEWCACGCDCWQTSPEVGDEEDFDDECPDHLTPYEDCAYLHEADYTNAVQNVQHLGGVLYIRDPPLYEQIHLDVPTEYVNCCPCPDHWTNYVGVAYKSYRLRLVDSDGLPFSKAGTSCDVSLAGVYPSSAVGDATLAFSRNGEIYQQHDKTVLGVAIKGDYGVDLADYNSLNSGFGYPMTVCTNLWDAPSIRLATNVKLPSGYVHLELADATGQFTFWYYDNTTWEYRKLIDTDSSPVKDLSMSYWKALMRRGTYGDSSELPIRITSSATGTVSLVFRYWNVIDGKFVEDQAVQRITSVNPPLMADYNRDGRIDDDDVRLCMAGRVFRYWINECKVTGAVWNEPSLYEGVANALVGLENWRNRVVDGAYDLVNFFPIAVDFAPFLRAWGNGVTFVVTSESGPEVFNYTVADIDRLQAGTIRTAPHVDVNGNALAEATLSSLGDEGRAFSYAEASSFVDGSCLFVAEAAKSRVGGLKMSVRVGGEELYSFTLPIATSTVDNMFRFLSIRGAHDVEMSAFTGTGSPSNNPDFELADKDVFFVHGFNVDMEGARNWNREMFKRLWVSGMNARYWGVTWSGDSGLVNGLHYHRDVRQALMTAPTFRNLVNQHGHDAVVIGHSLGNMVVSEALLKGANARAYIMLDAAVASEAYRPDLQADSDEILAKYRPGDWNGYDSLSWAANWYTWFTNDVNDARGKIGWAGHFAPLLSRQGLDVYNFYSSGDEVFKENSETPGIATGVFHWPTLNLEWPFFHLNWELDAYPWQKQEVFKGVNAAGSLSAGWGFHCWATNIDNQSVIVRYSAAGANAMVADGSIVTNAVFDRGVSAMFSPTISDYDKADILAFHIPAVSSPAGKVVIRTTQPGQTTKDFNLNELNCRANGWGRIDPDDPNIFMPWLHSDVKNMAYYYVYPAFTNIVEKGAMK